ncbi:hypothetical protein BaRGS_00039949 [Batillaria attramentaria]|uniref:Uncharacterized protein n=1 Tax=Batillaria attramentaria TaxID=370345 RepID=A0ABD0J1Y2_9CAEN
MRLPTNAAILVPTPKLSPQNGTTHSLASNTQITENQEHLTSLCPVKIEKKSGAPQKLCYPTSSRGYVVITFAI